LGFNDGKRLLHGKGRSFLNKGRPFFKGRRIIVNKRTGFTLIELLVVISIIALLVSILVPALSKAKEQAKAAVCLSNIHQWGVIWNMYIDDHKSRFILMDDNGELAPGGLDWLEPLEPYYIEKDILLCPSAAKPMYGEDRGRKFRAWHEDDNGNGVVDPGELIGSYGINYWITHSTEGGRINEYLWKTPYTKGVAYAPMFFDCTVSGNCPLHADRPPAYDGQIYTSHPGDIDEMRACCVNRHIEHINMAFLDFSARKVGLKELWELKWHRKWNVNNNPPPDFCTVSANYDGWMCYMKDYAGI